MEKKYHLLYVSKAAVEMTDEELRKIRDVGLLHNELADVYGVLLYREGNFLQLLEGPQDAVESTFERIKADPRHTEVRTIYRGQCTKSNYCHYNMGVITADSLPLFHASSVADLTEQIESIKDEDSAMDEMLTDIIYQFAKLGKIA